MDHLRSLSFCRLGVNKNMLEKKTVVAFLGEHILKHGARFSGFLSRKKKPRDLVFLNQETHLLDRCVSVPSPARAVEEVISWMYREGSAGVKG